MKRLRTVFHCLDADPLFRCPGSLGVKIRRVHKPRIQALFCQRKPKMMVAVERAFRHRDIMHAPQEIRNGVHHGHSLIRIFFQQLISGFSWQGVHKQPSLAISTDETVNRRSEIVGREPAQSHHFAHDIIGYRVTTVLHVQVRLPRFPIEAYTEPPDSPLVSRAHA